jgi:hypothetical protein
MPTVNAFTKPIIPEQTCSRPQTILRIVLNDKEKL